MQASLLTTKLFFPQARNKLVPRPQLLERLSKGLAGPLTLISAPVGYGKTTLMSEWRAGPGAKALAAWVSIDAADNDPARFFFHLVASLDQALPGLLDEVQPLLQVDGSIQPEAILTLLINQLQTSSKDIILALDDYHLIDCPVVHHAVTFLIEHLPSRLHLVLLTRADPPLPLARLRARGKMVEIRGEHLRFHVEDCQQFLNRIMGLSLSAEQVAALEARTEGWVAGLQLAGVSMQGRADLDRFVASFTGSHHYIVDYLVEEVLSNQEESLRDFLLKTSILDRFTGPLCDALTGQSGGAARLEALDHANLFVIPLDDEQRWYRYHHLFSDLLHSRLVHSNAQIVPQLHRIASGWFDSNGLPDEAIQHALAAGDFDLAARLFCRNELEVIYSRSLSTLQQWLDAFPQGFLTSNPWLCVAKLHVLWSSGLREDMGVYTDGAKKALDDWLAAGRLTVESREHKILLGETLIFQSIMAMRQNDLSLALELAQQSAGALPRDSRPRAFALGCLYMVYGLSGEVNRAIGVCHEAIAVAREQNYPSMVMAATYTLADLLRTQGKLSRAIEVLQDGLAYARQKRQDRLFYTGILNIELGETLYERYELEQVEAEYETGIALCRLGGKNFFTTIGNLDLAEFKHNHGDPDEALAILEDVEQDEQLTVTRAHRGTTTIIRLLWQAQAGDLTGVEDGLRNMDLEVGAKVGTEQCGRIWYALHFLRLLGKHDEGLRLIERAKPAMQPEGLNNWLLYMLVMETYFAKMKGEEGRALDCLKQALALAEGEGFVRVFVVGGEPIRELLLSLRKEGAPSAFIRRILSAFDWKLAKTSPAPVVKPPPDILSKREIELLRMVAAGCSNKEIAGRLVISIGTVKRHTTNIFTKLDVQNRTEAVARARELGLL